MNENNDGIGNDDTGLEHSVSGQPDPSYLDRETVDANDEFEKWLFQNIHTVEIEFWPNLQAIYDKYKALKSQR